MWCKFQDVFLCHMATNVGAGGSDYYIWGEVGGVDLYGLSLPSQVTAQVQHVERKQKLSWLSPSPHHFCSSLLLILLLLLCFALLHSLCLLDLPVSSTQLVVARGRRRWRRRWGTNGPLLFWHVYGVHNTHTHTLTHA